MQFYIIKNKNKNMSKQQTDDGKLGLRTFGCKWMHVKVHTPSGLRLRYDKSREKINTRGMHHTNTASVT